MAISDDRLQSEQTNALLIVDGCSKTRLKSHDGTWEDDIVRDVLASNRPQAYLEGQNLTWLCETCWVASLNRRGVPSPTGATVAAK
eukprot:8351790-Pyramimonas_sp.AAC.1